MTGDPGRARFAVAGPDVSPDLLAALPVGEPEYPDRSATVVMAVDGLTPGRGLRLTGPGIHGQARLRVDGPGPEFFRLLRDNRALFPLGLDFIFVSKGRAACVPRSVLAEE